MADKEKLQLIISAEDQASKDIDKVKSHLNGLTDASKQFTIGAMAVGAGLLAIGVQAVKTSAMLETNRIGFITLLGSAEKADEAIKMIKKDAASTPFELPGLLQANQLLTSVTKDAGRSEVLLLNVGKALSAMGKGQPELDRIIVNLQQIGAVGKASMMDVKQFAFAGIPIFEMLKDTFKVTGAELEDMIKNGEVSFEKLEEMFIQAGSEGGKFADAFTNAAGSFNQLFSNMKDNLTVFLASFVEQIGLMDFLKDALSKIIDYTNILTTMDWKKWLEDNKIALEMLAGAIIGMMIPALISWGVALAGLAVYLIPLAIAGAALTWVWTQYGDTITAIVLPAIQQLIEWFNSLGGFMGIIGGIIDWFRNSILAPLGEILTENSWIVDWFRQQWEKVYAIFVENLLPTLLNLYDTIKPFLPLIGEFAKVIGIILAVAIGVAISLLLTFIEKLTWLLKIITDVTKWLAEHMKPGIDAMADGIKTLVNWVSQLINKLIELKDKAAGAFGGVVGKVTGFFGGGKADGGAVNSRSSYLVGEQGPELFTPGVNGNITPNNKLGGGTTINVNVTGTFMDGDSAEKFGDIMVRKLAGLGVQF